MSPAVLRSLRNPRIKAARQLQHRKGRRAQGRFLVEGLTHIAAALEAGGWLETLFWSPARLTSPFGQTLVERARAAGVAVWEVTPQVLDRLSLREASQGLVAVARQRYRALDTLRPEAAAWVVAVVQPQDPGNLGALWRTLDAAGATGPVLLDGGVDPFHPTAVRASLGALFWHPPVAATWDDLTAWARGHGYALYGSSAHGTVDYRAAAYRFPAVLVLGNERRGLSPAQREACAAVVRIPMTGHVRSLNLAVAAGLLLYAMREALPPRPSAPS